MLSQQLSPPGSDQLQSGQRQLSLQDYLLRPRSFKNLSVEILRPFPSSSWQVFKSCPDLVALPLSDGQLEPGWPQRSHAKVIAGMSWRRGQPQLAELLEHRSELQMLGEDLRLLDQGAQTLSTLGWRPQLETLEPGHE